MGTSQSQMSDIMEAVFAECRALRDAGQKEYAGVGRDAFSNFNRVAQMTGLDRKAGLMVYALKHWDGIVHHIQGETSQRENVRGRINDLIVYMGLLRGMIDEEEGIVPPKQPEPLTVRPMQRFQPTDRDQPTGSSFVTE
jgi:hypothetical protein